MEYLAILGRIPKISLAELESVFSKVTFRGGELATFESAETPDIRRLGGSLKLGEKLPGGFEGIINYLETLPEGKITLGLSSFERGANFRNSTEVEQRQEKTPLSRSLIINWHLASFPLLQYNRRY